MGKVISFEIRKTEVVEEDIFEPVRRKNRAQKAKEEENRRKHNEGIARNHRLKKDK